MIRRMLFPLAAAAVLVVVPARSQAQETPKPDAAKEITAERRGPQGVSLRVQVVITRSQGDKKLASLPYTLVVSTGDSRARMRMGVDTPIPVTPAESGKPAPSIQYRNVGTNIDCTARDVGEGRYRLVLGVENSSALALEKGPSGGGNPPPWEGSPTGIPLFRSFNTSFDLVLRDGQSLQALSATDPVTGEVVKVDVALSVVK